MEYNLTGQAGERRKFLEAFEEFCRQNCVPDAARKAADLALEEHLTNVLNYGFKDGDQRLISVSLHVENDALYVKVTDTGKAYDPLWRPAVDTSLSLEEKPIGGLGVHLMRQFMDALSYMRDGQTNVLWMTKGFDG